MEFIDVLSFILIRIMLDLLSPGSARAVLGEVETKALIK